MATVKTVPVSSHVKEILDDMKDAEMHTSYDSLLRSMIREYDVDFEHEGDSDE